MRWHIYKSACTDVESEADSKSDDVLQLDAEDFRVTSGRKRYQELNAIFEIFISPRGTP
jgi:hypothetical protein